MKDAFHRVKVPLAGLFGIVLVTLIAFAAVNPDALTAKGDPSWTITGNAVLDDALFDARFDASLACGRTYDPVCATDGQTYANLCEAHKADVDMRHRGACTDWVQVS